LEWKVQFKLASESEEGGYIVQHVHIDAYMSGLDGYPVSHRLNGVDYWEAWRVDPGSDVTTYGARGDYDDMYRVAASPPGTHGAVHITGTVRFYEGLDLPSDFIVRNPLTLGGILPSTNVDPHLPLQNASAPANHSYSLYW
jgi:hypothetical protein